MFVYYKKILKFLKKNQKNHFILKKVPSLNVPDTILFQNDLPYMWYFVKDRCLKRKSNINLTLEEIEKKFLKKTPKCGIVALYINQLTKDSNEKVIFEYLTVPQFSKKIAFLEIFSLSFQIF